MKSFKTYIQEVNGGPISADPSPTPSAPASDIMNKLEKHQKKTKKDEFVAQPTLTPIVTRG